jgi:hypothetical protein
LIVLFGLDTDVTPQFRGMLLEAIARGSLSTDMSFGGCGGPFERTDHVTFASLPIEITEFGPALHIMLRTRYVR